MSKNNSTFEGAITVSELISAMQNAQRDHGEFDIPVLLRTGTAGRFIAIENGGLGLDALGGYGFILEPAGSEINTVATIASTETVAGGVVPAWVGGINGEALNPIPELLGDAALIDPLNMQFQAHELCISKIKLGDTTLSHNNTKRRYNDAGSLIEIVNVIGEDFPDFANKLMRDVLTLAKTNPRGIVIDTILCIEMPGYAVHGVLERTA